MAVTSNGSDFSGDVTTTTRMVKKLSRRRKQAANRLSGW